MNKSIILHCQQLIKRYDQGGLNVDVLKGVDLEIRVGERVAIMGASGSGKSTLLHLLGGLEKATSGEVILEGVNINQVSGAKLAKLRNKSLGFIYQSHHLLGEFTVLENVAMPLLIAGETVKQARVRAIELLKRVGLGHRIEHKPGELSGGERQRAAVARALINKPSLILADEPTGNLDPENSAEIIDLLLKINKLGTTVVLASHDRDIVDRASKRVIVLEKGKIVRDDKEGKYVI